MNETHKVLKVTSKDGTKISYIKKGKGKPLLCVHGSTADHRSWAVMSHLFDKDFTFYAMDRRGRGESKDSTEYDFIHEAEDIVAVVEAIGKPVYLFGHSFGGLCSLEASLLTDKISRLILYEPPIPTGTQFIPTGVTARIQELIDAGNLEAAIVLFLKDVARFSEKELETYRQSPLWKVRIPLALTIPRELTIEQTYRFNAERFADFQTPTMLLLGSKSPEFYSNAIKTLDKALPKSKVVVLPDQSHMVHYTNPELLENELKRFLTG